MSKYEDSHNNRTGSRGMSSSSRVPASYRKDDKTYPAISHSEEVIYTIVNYWLANGIIDLPRPWKLPTENEKFHSRYCKYHQYIGHSTMRESVEVHSDNRLKVELRGYFRIDTREGSMLQ